MPKLSVVIPALNEERCLPGLLEELSKQTFRDFEIIVADAHSNDRTREVAERAGARVVDGGLPSVGRNRGADAAAGELIFFFDADVVLQDEDFLKRAVEEFENNNLDIATADVGVIHGTTFDDLAHGFYNLYVRAVNRWHPHAPGFCILVRKALHDSIGGFDEQIVFCEDHEYAVRASKRGKFGLLNSVKVFATTRRQERDGRIAMAVKYVLAELHMIFIGPIRGNKFKYGFGYEEKK